MNYSIYRENASKFVPCQHYYNTQIMIRAFFVSVAQGQALEMQKFYWYLKGSDHIEQIFSILRTLRNTGTNFDAVQIEDLTTESQRIERICTRRPVLKRNSRRLGGRDSDHLNLRTILGNPINESLVALDKVDLRTCWLEGRRMDKITLRKVLRPWGGVSKPFDYVGVAVCQDDDDVGD